MKENLAVAYRDGSFERDFPEGAWKELMRAAATGQEPNMDKIGKFAGPPVIQESAPSNGQYRSYSDLSAPPRASESIGFSQMAPPPPAIPAQPTIDPLMSKQPEYQSYADLAATKTPQSGLDQLQQLQQLQQLDTLQQPPLDIQSPPPVPLDLTPPPLDPSNKPKRYNKYGDEI